jgi:hypothetical protein
MKNRNRTIFKIRIRISKMRPILLLSMPLMIMLNDDADPDEVARGEHRSVFRKFTIP